MRMSIFNPNNTYYLAYAATLCGLACSDRVSVLKFHNRF
jgi:hypothetical protein